MKGGKLILGLLILPLLTSCLKSELDDYDEWRKQNDEFVKNINTSEYTPITPDWAPFNTIYMKWYNDRSKTADNLQPLANSTIEVKYELEDIDGKLIGTSYKANGDSLYQSKPSDNIIGFMAAVTTMHVGDSVSLLIPYQSAYGKTGSGAVKPYSTLVYRVKLVSISAYEK